MTTQTTAATDSKPAETSAAVVASLALTSNIDFPAALGGETDVAAIKAGAPANTRPAPALRYRRACGSGSWTLRHVRRMAPATVAAVYAIAARSPDWDATVDDTVSYALLDGSGDLADLFLFMEGLRAA